MPFDTTTYEKPAAPVVDEVGAIILKARELLSDPKRWCKGGTSGGAVCIHLALNQAVNNSVRPLLDAVDRVSALLGGTGFAPIWDFNDAPETTHADVLALLDRAAGSV